ncbi:hypothetical protein [Myxococcus stipitatus]
MGGNESLVAEKDRSRGIAGKQSWVVKRDDASVAGVRLSQRGKYQRLVS